MDDSAKLVREAANTDGVGLGPTATPSAETRSEPYQDADWWPQTVRDGDFTALKRAIDEKPSGLRWQDKFGRTLLHVAAANNRVGIINLLVSLQFDVNATDDHGFSPLHEAIRFAQEDAIHCLVTAGSDVNLQTSCNLSALQLAVELNQIKSLQALLSHTAVVNPDAVDDSGCSGMHHASAKNHHECLTVLLKHGAKPCAKNHAGLTCASLAAYAGSADALRVLFDCCKERNISAEYFLNTSDAEGNLLLHAAVDSGSLESVKVCLQYGAHIDTHQDDQSTPVHFAALRGELAILHAMFEAQPHRKQTALALTDKNGMTALHKAVLFDNVSVAQFLMDEGAQLDVPDVNEHTPLLLAASKCSVKCVLLLLQRGANMVLVDKDGRNFVHLAVLSNTKLDVIFGEMANIAHVNLLFNSKDYFGCTPLHYASIEGHLAAADDLLNSGARVRIPTHNKTTAIHLAAQYGRFNTCRKLLDSAEGSRIINMTDNRGLTALHLASMNGHTKVVHLLLERGAIFHKGYCGKSPFAMAALNGHVKTMKLLLTVHPYLLNMACRTGNTALHAAGVFGHVEVTEFLLTEGAEITLNDSGQTFLDLALKKRNKEVCVAAMKHERWREILSTVSPTYPSPIFGLIEELPEVCFEVLERCVTDNNKPPSGEDYAVTYDFTFLELSRASTYSESQKAQLLDWTMLDRERDRSFNKDIQSEPNKNEENALLEVQANETSTIPSPTNAERFAHIIDNSLPIINHMVKYGRVDLLVSPLCREYMNMKWHKFARSHVLASNLAHLFALVVLLVTVWVAPPVIQCSLLIANNCSGGQNKTCVEVYRQSALCNTPMSFEVCLCLLLAYVLYRIAIFAMFTYSMKLRYFKDLENVLVLFITASLLVFIIPTFVCMRNGDICTYQWNFLAFAAAAESFAFILNLRILGDLGLYVVMFVEILKTLAKTAALFGVLITGFAMAFTVLFQVPIENDSDYQDYSAGLAYGNPFLSSIRVMAMATGELELRDTILAGLIDPSLKKALPFSVTTVIMFVLFVVIVTVAMLNLIVGLAIGDIKVVRNSATLRRLSIQSEFYTVLENYLYRSHMTVCVRDSRPQSVTLYPNARRSFFRRLVDQLESTVEMGRPKAIDQAVESTKRLKFQESVTKQLNKHKLRFKKLTSALEKQAEHVEQIVSKLEIKSEKKRHRDEGRGNSNVCKDLKSTKAHASVNWQQLYKTLSTKSQRRKTEVPIALDENVAFLNGHRNDSVSTSSDMKEPVIIDLRKIKVRAESVRT